MKAKLFTIVLLMGSLVAYSQPSRRGESDRNDEGSRARTSDNQSERKRSQGNSSSQEVSRSKGQEYTRKAESDNRSGERQETERNRSDGNYFKDRNRGDVAMQQRGGYSRDNDNRDRYKSRNDDRGYRSGSYNSGHSTRYDRVVEIRRPGTRVEVVHYNRHNYRPLPAHYRRIHHPYRVPYSREIIWSINLSHSFSVWYPEIRFWRYPVGYRITAVSAYDADDYVGEVATIYGKVIDVNYSHANDEYYLYFGDYFPYHDFSIVISGYEARKFSSRPERYFINEHLSVTGYITRYDGKPEIIVRQSNQINLY